MFISLPLHTLTGQITIFWMPLQNKSKLWREIRGIVHINSFGSSTISVKCSSEVKLAVIVYYNGRPILVC